MLRPLEAAAPGAAAGSGYSQPAPRRSSERATASSVVTAVLTPVHRRARRVLESSRCRKPAFLRIIASLPTPVFLPGESQGRGSLVGCRLWGRTELDMTEAT